MCICSFVLLGDGNHHSKVLMEIKEAIQSYKASSYFLFLGISTAMAQGGRKLDEEDEGVVKVNVPYFVSVLDGVLGRLQVTAR